MVLKRIVQKNDLFDFHKCNDKLYKPLKHKEILRKELPLIQVVAEMVIVKSGEVL